MNLYWSIYESLEEEVLRLVDDIFFNEDQLKVYSIKIGNLIVRCAIEIESLAKELYCSLGGEPLIFDEKENANRRVYFDTDCLDLLVKTWKINNKKIQIVSPKMNFTENFSILAPLHKSNKRGTSGSKWKQTYQEFKHNRAQGIKTATVGNLLGALGALYILNLYHRNDSFWYDVPIEGREEYRTHSKIFSPFVCDVSNQVPLRNDDNLIKANTKFPFDESIYIKKYTDDSATQIRDLICSYELDLQLQTISSDEFLNYFQKQLNNQADIDLRDFVRETRPDLNEMFKNFKPANISPKVFRSKEIVLNKCQQIYPDRTWNDFLGSLTAQKILNDRLTALNKKLPSFFGE